MTTLARQPDADRAAEPVGNRADDSPCACAHCGLPVPPGLIVAERREQFCCQGCASVYELIRGCGLDTYYRLREQSGDETSRLASESDGDRLGVFGSETFEDLYVIAREDGTRVVDLRLEGVRCAACVWLIEKLPRVVPGVIEARLSLREATVRVVWDPERVGLIDVAKALNTLGYPPHPARRGADAVHRLEQRAMLFRMGVAGALAGNTMLLAFALYAGLFGGMEDRFTQLFRWVSAGLGVLSLAWPGRVFFRGAWASLRTRSPHLDLPIALALGVGGVAGFVNVVMARGEIYFDSLTVLVFLLLVGRFIQYRQQRRADESVGLLLSLTPASVRRVSMTVRGESVERLPIEAAEVGDLLEVRAGELIPADGLVESGSAMLSSSLLTGESEQVPIGPGDAVCAGAQLSGSTIRLRVSAVGERTRAGRLLELVRRGVSEKPTIVALTDRIAGWFVVVVSVLALAVFAAWSAIDLGLAVDHTVALLIIACPCALGLATPLSLAVAIGRAARRDILIKSGAVFDRLARPGRLLIDKTGTMTRGVMRVEAWAGDRSVEQLVAAVERQSPHPIARAIVASVESNPDAKGDAAMVWDVEAASRGMAATTDRGRLLVGARGFVESRGVAVAASWVDQARAWAGRACTTVFVALDGELVAAVAVGDALHADARESIAQLRRWGWRIAMLTGDEPAVAETVAEAVGLAPESIRSRVTPEGKLAAAKSRGGELATVMVGDGVNDAAALAAADVGIAVSGGAEASLAAADVYLARPGLSGLVSLVARARRSRRVIAQTLGVSLAYNASAIGLAAFGLVTPLVAAVLMPLSSAAVLALAMKGQVSDGGWIGRERGVGR